ncbi:MAG: tetratricopeptide repeat protein [Cyanobacteriota bacterium]|nr:tetratricopeptide repeat protein [Cyanobacteriota bacterium]
MKLSLCAIVLNEEESLSRCLESVGDVVDEMVVLDTGSRDRTIEIAKKEGARVYSFQWGNDFAAARNEALRYARGEWVLVLDADEVLNPKIIPQLKEAIANEDYLLINLLRQEVGATQSPYSLTSRLFRNRPELEFSHPYHAMVDDSVVALVEKEPRWKVVSLPSLAIFHYGYQPETIAAKSKFKRARESMEAFLATHPDDAYTENKLGALYLQEGRFQEGIQLLESALTKKQIDAPVLFEIHYHLGNGYARLSNPNKAVRHYQEAIAQPILPQLKLGAYNNLGGLLQAAGEYQLAEKIYKEALKIDPNFAIAHYNLAMTYKAIGNFKEAIAACEASIRLNPDRGSAYQNLGVIWLKCGNFAKSEEAFKKAIALHQQRNPQEAQRLRQELQAIGFSNL